MLSNYKKLNNLLGWAVFAIATTVYVLTLEPTVSFWDCGEYIATSVKLQVGHPPGAPFFQMLGSFFGLLAFGDVNMQAFWVNMMSALSSSFTILFLFWTITALAKKLALKTGDIDQGKMISIFGAGAVGALAYTFSDSFWFSAVEGEVYAMSSFFTAAAFWAVIKWEEAVDTDKYANRWLILIAFMVGLSVGVHILVFLTIPAIGMVYYFKKYPNPTRKGFILANAASVGVLMLVFAILIPLLLSVLGKTEIFFVNTLNLPFNSGTILVVVALCAAVVWGLKYTQKKNLPLWNQAILGMVFLFIGYSSYIMLAVRSNANPPIDENNPEDAMSLLDYYNRKQYGDWPVLYGRYYNAGLDNAKPFSDDSPTYVKGYAVLDGKKEIISFREEWEAEDFVAKSGQPFKIDGKYIMSNDGKLSKPNYAKSHIGFFPRMWSDDPGYVQNYVQYADLKKDEKRPPSFAENFKFFWRYQFGDMYWRYFMWNFSGRQSDEQFRGERTKGNWITGIPFIDEIRLGPQKDLPKFLKENPGRNKYYMLPLILGLIGLVYHFKKDNKDAWTVFLFFVFTGLAIVIYTNHKAFEPRERDYAFVGSFYAFAIWIGLGVVALYEMLKTHMKKPSSAVLITVFTLVLVPGIMAKENWDDHDRSNRYVARDIAKAYLDSCAPNAILFTNGDNDTFPLWYVQEVEGYRTDVRVVNLSLLNTDWYIDQMKRQTYDGAPVPFTFNWNQYKQGTRDVVYFQQQGRGGRWMVDDFVNYLKRDDEGVMMRAMGNRKIQFYPVNQLRIPINKEQVLANGVVGPEDADNIVDFIDWNLDANLLTKRDIMVVDLIAGNDWTRPIYFSITVGNSPKAYFWLDQYFRLEGLAYRFVPIRRAQRNQGLDFGAIDTDIMYDNLMNKFAWGNMELPDVYLDETARRTIFNLRTIYGRLALALAAEGKMDKAIAVADLAMEKMPTDKYGFDYFLFSLVDAYYSAGDTEKGRKLVNDFAASLDEELEYYKQFKTNRRKEVSGEIDGALQYYQFLAQTVQEKERALQTQDPGQNDLYQRFVQHAQAFGRM